MTGSPTGHSLAGSAAHQKMKPTMNNLLQKAEVVYGWFLTSVNSLQSPFLLAIRLFWPRHSCAVRERTFYRRAGSWWRHSARTRFGLAPDFIAVGGRYVCCLSG